MQSFDCKGKTLSSENFALAVRIRMGTGGLEDGVICANCGEGNLGPAGTHGLICAKVPSTRDELFHFARGIGASTQFEHIGLVRSRPALRPAAVLIFVSDHLGRPVAIAPRYMRGLRSDNGR